MNDRLMRAYLDNITETRRFLERQENRLYSLLVDSRIGGGENSDAFTPVTTRRASGYQRDSFEPVIRRPLRRPFRSPPSPPTTSPSRRIIIPPISPTDPVQGIMDNLLRGIGIDISGGASPFPQTWWDPIAIVPTEEDIERGVETGRFMDISDESAMDISDESDMDATTTLCPITQTEFQATDEVMRIIECGHIFSSGGLREWFTHSVRCPVCRHDVRNTVTPDTHDTTPEPIYGNSTTLPIPATEFLERTFGSISGAEHGILDASGAVVSGYGNYLSDDGVMSFSVEITDGSGNVYHPRDFNMR